MSDISRIQRELYLVNSLLQTANFTSSARPHLEELKATLERELSALREREEKQASAAAGQ